MEDNRKRTFVQTARKSTAIHPRRTACVNRSSDNSPSSSSGPSALASSSTSSLSSSLSSSSSSSDNEDEETNKKSSTKKRCFARKRTAIQTPRSPDIIEIDIAEDDTTISSNEEAHGNISRESQQTNSDMVQILEKNCHNKGAHLVEDVQLREKENVNRVEDVNTNNSTRLHETNGLQAQRTKQTARKHTGSFRPARIT